MKNKNTINVITAACALMMAIPAHATLTAVPASQIINIGNTAFVNINISGLGNGVAPALAAYTGLLISYNSSILTPTSVTFSNRLGDPTDPSQALLLSDIFLPNAVQLDGLSFLTGPQLFAAQANPNGVFTLATISFLGSGAGTSPINLSYGALSDENGNAINQTVTNGSITVNGSNVPEPTTYSLISVALVGASLLKRWRQK